jgi:hypothetical protein
MAEPEVVDLRPGLTAEFLEGMRRADRVVIAAKGLNTGALGYWLDEHLTIGVLECAIARVIRIPRRNEVQVQLTPTTVPGSEVALQPGVLLDLHTAGDEFWGRVLGVVRAGDTLRVAPDPDKPGTPALYVFSHGVRVALLRLPRPPARRRSAA